MDDVRRGRRWSRPAGILLVSIATGAIATAQDDARPVAQFQTRADVIAFDVTVLDRDRRPVRGLTAADFTIVDDGQERAIVGFTAVELPPAPVVTNRARPIVGAISDVATNEAADGRLVTIMLDHSIPAGWGAQAARRVAHAVVDQLGPGDRAAIVFSNRALAQSFTSDRERLRAVIDSPVVGTSLAQTQGMVVGTIPDGAGTGTGWTVDQQRNEVGPTPPARTGNCFCGMCTLDTITTVAESVTDVSERRKLLVFIGGYMPLNAEAWSKDSPCQPWLPPVIQRTLRAAQRANLTIYAYDPHGLLAPAQYGAAARLRGGQIATSGLGSQDTLRSPEALLVATDHTGGRTIFNSNAPEERVTDMFEESSSYYLLGFGPAADAQPGSFRNVTVRVNRPDVQVLARRGYYVPGSDAPSDDDGGADPLAAALRGLLPQTPMPMQLTLAPFPAAEGSALAVTAAIERDTAAPLELLAAAFDRTGRLVASTRQTVQPAASGGSSHADEVFTQLVLPEPGGYHVRVAARDSATGRIASVHDVVDVPAFAREPVSLSGIVVHASRAPQRSITALTDFLPIVPTTRRTFARDEAVTVYAQVAQREPADAVRMTARVFDATGEPLLEHGELIAAETFTAAGATFYRLDLPLVRLAAGPYLLNVEAMRGATRISRTMRFEVR